MAAMAVLTEEQLEQLLARAVAPLRAELERMRGHQAGDLVTLPEAARRLGVSPRTVQRWAKQGQLEVIRVGASRRVRLPEGSPAG